MALTLLDGTDATVDLGVALSGGTSTTSLRCIINAMEYRSGRGFQTAKTLCSGKWESEKPGTNQDFIRVTKFASKGSTISDLSPLLTATASASITFTAFTGCTKSGTFWLDGDSLTVSAGNYAMPGEATFRSDGAILTVWVTT